MNKNLKNISYSDEEIIELANKIHDSYELIFKDKGLPKYEVLSLANMLSNYPQSEDKKIMTLEYATRIKFEIQNYLENINSNTNKDPKYFDYKKNDFAVKKAILDIYGSDDERKINEDIPKLIKMCTGNAYFKLFKEYGSKAKVLSLTDK